MFLTDTGFTCKVIKILSCYFNSSSICNIYGRKCTSSFYNYTTSRVELQYTCTSEKWKWKFGNPPNGSPKIFHPIYQLHLSTRVRVIFYDVIFYINDNLSIKVFEFTNGVGILGQIIKDCRKFWWICWSSILHLLLASFLIPAVLKISTSLMPMAAKIGSGPVKFC